MQKFHKLLTGTFLTGLICFTFAGEFIEMESLFIRATGQPQEETITFTVYNPDQQFYIKVQNGPEGYDRISSASVSFLLNEEELFTSSDFNQQVEWLEKEVSLVAENTIRILLTSKPGAALKITVYGIDEGKPTINFTAPDDNAILNTDHPTVSLSYDDIESGVVLSTLQILINSEDRTSYFDVTQNAATLDIPPEMPLPEGQIIADAEITDRGENTESHQIKFTVDITPPVITFISPTNGETLDLNTPYIKVAYTDAISGIDAATVQVILNTIDVTADFTIDADSAVYQVPVGSELPEGENKLVLSVNDIAGNIAKDSIAFQVQTSKLKSLPEAYPDSGLVPLTVHFKTKGECTHSTINWYKWDFEGDGVWNTSTQVAQDYTFTYNAIGVYFPKLEVTNMLSERDTAEIRIVASGPPPVAHAQALPTNGGAPLEVTFSGWGEKTGGYVKYHDWDVDGDGVVDNTFRVTPDTSLLMGNDFESGIGGWQAGAISGEMGVFNPGSINLAWTAHANAYSNNSYLTSSEIDLTETDNCTLAFDVMLQYVYYTYAYVYVVRENGSSTYITYYSNSINSSQSFNLNSFCGQKIKLMFRFYTYYNSTSLWQIDNIVLSNSQGDVFFSDDCSSSEGWDLSQSQGIWGHEQSGLLPVAQGSKWVEPDPSTFTYQNDMDCWVTSPDVTLPDDGNLWLRYWQYCATADNGDGGIVELSVDNGDFVLIEPVGGYPGTIIDHGSGFTGNTGTTRPLFDLSSYAGSTIKLRYHFFSNETGTARGWLIDSVCVIQVLPPSDGVNGNTTTVVYIFDTPGTYNATLKVTDNEGKTATASAMTTVIDVGPPGSPTVNASASPTSGTAPLNVGFTASATDPDGHVVLYEWDFDNDGTYEWSSTSNGNTSHSYTAGGHFVAVCQVTDNDGLTSHQYFDIFVDITASLAIVESDRTFNPYNSETITIRTKLSGEVPAIVYLKNRNGSIVRTLVDNIDRAAGTYNDAWDGRDDEGDLVPAGAYYAVLEYILGNEVRTIDLTNNTGGQQYNPSRVGRSGYWIYPYRNVHLPITFTIVRPSEVTLFMGVLSGQDYRLRTIINREQMGAGTYNVTWDGLSDDGTIPKEYSGNIVPGIWGYYLPDNAVWISANTPEITALSTDPIKFAPMSEKCTPTGDQTGLTLTYGVSADVPKVRMKIFNLSTGQQIHSRDWDNIGSGSHAVFWNGKDDAGRAMDEGSYRIGFCTVDAFGNESIIRYNLMKTLYSFNTERE